MNSVSEVNAWFHSLNTETQELLKSLRRERCKRAKVAILDTGIDLTHRYFQDEKTKKRSKRIKAVEDFVNPTGNAHDICGHGTHCVGLLRQVAPEADIYVARVIEKWEGKINPEIVAKVSRRPE
jgi:hypothetical protein